MTHPKPNHRCIWQLALRGFRVHVALTVLAVLCPTLAAGAGQPGVAVAESSVARLSDQEVRKLLIDQLAAGRSDTGNDAVEFNPAVTMLRLQRQMGRLGDELHEIFSSVNELPTIFPRAWASFMADREQGGLADFVLAVAVSMGIGVLCAYLLRARVNSALGARSPRPASVRRKAAVLGSRFMLHMVYVAVFGLAATVAYVAAFEAGQKDRIAFFFYLAASVIFLTSIAVSVAFHSPGHSHLRLPLYTDAEARSMHRTVLLTVGVGAFAFFTCAFVGTLGVLGPVHELFLILVGLITTSLMIHSILSARVAITRDLRSDAPPGSARAVVARLWPVAFALAVALMFVSLVAMELLYDFVPYGAILFTIGLMAVVPSLDALLYRETLRLREQDARVKAAVAGGGRLALVLLIAIAMCAAWRINPFSAGEESLGAKAANMALQVSLTLTIAYVLWHLVRITIDQKIAEEDAVLAAQGIDASESEIGGTGLSRMRTLLPLLKRTVQVSLLVMSTMIVLASLGVDIAPLLAGAGVVGLAIGFGSQTLVRDIVSGAFFLLDDAFRIGEYIDVGSVKGSVEKMSVRSVRLRHHRGAVHTVPFGEVKTLTNYSRDWAIMKLRFRVPFDTDVDKVRKILKATGLELAQNADIKDDFIQPFKSQGVTEVDDYGFVISTKFMSKPGKQFIIRRYAFAAVQSAFEANGIEFATPKVEVVVEEDEDGRPSSQGSGTSARSARRRHDVSGAAASHAINTQEPAT